MREPPGELTDADVLAVVQSEWDDEISRVEHLGLGFGAHHWRAEIAGRPQLFVTYDRLGERHTLQSLENAYDGAIALAASGLEFVVAPLRTRRARSLVPVAAGALSCTPWLDGVTVGAGPVDDEATAAANLRDLDRLHRTRPPAGLRRWAPIVDRSLLDRIETQIAERRESGPYAERVRRALTVKIDAIRDWTRRYEDRAAQASQHAWVPTHGETHTRNQVRTAAGIRFVDWESLMLAPRERDLSTLVQADHAKRAGADAGMLELFDLEWRLDEIDVYARWFAADHSGTTDDEIAFEGLLEQLGRGPWWPAGTSA